MSVKCEPSVLPYKYTMSVKCEPSVLPYKYIYTISVFYFYTHIVVIYHDALCFLTLERVVFLKCGRVSLMMKKIWVPKGYKPDLIFEANKIMLLRLHSLVVVYTDVMIYNIYRVVY
jgi:hypothetical protein